MEKSIAWNIQGHRKTEKFTFGTHNSYNALCSAVKLPSEGCSFMLIKAALQKVKKKEETAYKWILSLWFKDHLCVRRGNWGRQTSDTSEKSCLASVLLTPRETVKGGGGKTHPYLVEIKNSVGCLCSTSMFTDPVHWVLRHSHMDVITFLYLLQ